MWKILGNTIFLTTRIRWFFKIFLGNSGGGYSGGNYVGGGNSGYSGGNNYGSGFGTDGNPVGPPSLGWRVFPLFASWLASKVTILTLLFSFFIL